MPKRKVSDDEEDVYPSRSSDYESQPLESPSKQKVISKKQNQKSATRYAIKKTRIDEKSLSTSTAQKIGGFTKTRTISEDDKCVDLGKKRRVVVRSYKGVPLVDIREYYSADGLDKPGKKGISLTLEQWEILRDSAKLIDEQIAGKKND